MKIEKVNEHSEDQNQWVFDDKGYVAEDGIDLDTDKVEQVMKPQAGVRYVGDVRDKSFVPVGFEGSNKKDVPKPRVEFTKTKAHKKATQKTVSFFSRIENKIFNFIKKIR